MGKWKIMVLMCLAMAFAVLTWSPGPALAKGKGPKEGVVKGKVTRDDVARYLGKTTQAEQKAAAKRNRQLGLLPGVAGFDAQAPGPARAQ